MYICKRRKRRDGLLHVTTEFLIILVGLVAELIFAVEPKCTFFTVASASIILSGIHAAMAHLPSEVSSPKVTEKDYRELAIFAKKNVLAGPREKPTAYPQKLKARNRGTSNTLARGFRSLLNTSRTRRLLAYFVLNLAFMAVEIGYGFFSNSLGLISDGFHMFFDCFGLFVGLCAAFMSRWEGNDVYTYGYGRTQTLSCLVNCVSLVVISATIFLESLHRFFHAAEMHGSRLLSLSIVGLFVNLVGIFSFHGSSGPDVHCKCHHGHHGHGTSSSWMSIPSMSSASNHHHHHHHHHHTHCGDDDENMHSMFLHILADTMSSVGLIISSFLVQHYGWTIADPICSLLISTLIFTSVSPLLKLSWCVLLQGTTLSPERIVVLEQRLSETVVAATDGEVTVIPSEVVTELCVWDKFPGCLAATVVLCIPKMANEQRVLALALDVMSDFGISSSCIECVKK